VDTKTDFWEALEQLMVESRLLIDRAKGQPHPRFPDMVYPLNYGYLVGTTTVDGGGIDVWLGSGNSQEIVGVVCTVDLLKKDAEIKILAGCSEKEMETVVQFTQNTGMGCRLIRREKVDEA
jgi:inorganic pyrophosphatase